MTTDQPLRVAITSNTLHIGGAERQRVLLANGLTEVGHEVTFVVLQQLGPLADFLDTRVRLWQARATTGRLPHHHDAIVTGVTNTEAAFALGARLRAIGRTRWLAVSHSWPTGDRPLYPWPLRRLVGTASAIAGLTPTHVRELRTSEGWAHALEVLPNGTDVTLGPAPQPRKAPRLGFIGRLEHVKGADRLLRALEGLPGDLEWTLHVYGDGSQRADLEAFAAARSLPVTWHGWTSDVGVALGSLDLLVIPSRSEALPMVALEALAYGVPVIAAPVGALPEVLSAQDALLDADETGWPSQLEALVSDPDRVKRLRLDELSTANDWRAPVMVERYDSVLRRLVAGRR